MANLGKVVITPKGEYSTTENYVRLDCVLYEGSSWLALQSSIGVEPVEGEYWTLMAQGFDKEGLEEAMENKVSKGELAINARDYGAQGDGNENDGQAINEAITECSGSGGGTVFIPSGIFLTAETIIVRPGVMLKMTKNTILKPISNVNVLQIKPNSGFDGGGGSIDCSDMENFDKAAIYLDGADHFQPITGKTSTFAQNFKLINVQNDSGNGILFDCKNDGDFIQFVRMTGFDIIMFQSAIKMYVSNVDGAWCNANIFDSFTIQGSFYGFYLTGERTPNDVSGNYFLNWQYQSYYYYTDRIIKLKGSFNKFDGFVWDFDTDRQTLAIDIVEGVENVIHTNMSRYSSTFISDAGENTDISSPKDISKNILMPNSSGGFSFNGDQDDYLAYATSRYNVSSTSPTSGTVDNMFSPNGGETATWELPPDNPQITIDFEEDSIGSLSCLGVNFTHGNYARHIYVEYFDSNDEWVEIVDQVHNGQNFFAYSPGIAITDVRKLRFTFADLKSDTLSIVRIFAKDRLKCGQTWVSRSGGDVHGDLLFANQKGVVLESPNGTKYKIKVSNNGTLSASTI